MIQFLLFWAMTAVAALIVNMWMCHDYHKWWVASSMELKTMPKGMSSRYVEETEARVLRNAKNYTELRDARWKLVVWPLWLLWDIARRIVLLSKKLYARVLNVRNAHADRSLERDIMREQALNGLKGQS